LDNIVEKIDELDSRLQKVEMCMEQQKEARKPVIQMVWNVIGQIVYGITIAALTWWLIGR
jgi:phosphopantetheine adenylyltransferase